MFLLYGFGKASQKFSGWLRRQPFNSGQHSVEPFAPFVI